MTLPLARDLASHGVRANTIQIGHMDTELHMMKGPLSLIPFLISQIPFPKRFGYPEEYVHLVHTILDNPLINGEIIRLDGGVRFPFFKWTRP
ncbi:hypothetical protein FSP39_013854 [Pinctada imbricata]|uniref:Uncharacterized protein n=1 Tax=Pinctada imbricata TaxID=66713 RepID=A0AA88YJD0_PINIB|nr:hypothetical protein FSP39_013854 [Pinctada imbricata]